MGPEKGISTRTLITALIVLALLPNLTLAGYFWLPTSRSGGSEEPGAEATPPAALAESATENGAKTPAPAPYPVLTTPPRLEASPGSSTAFPITLDSTDGLPSRSIVAVSGLPHGATLSNGIPYGENGWNLKADEIGDVELHVPDDSAGATTIAIELLSPQGELLASASTTLNVSAAPEIAPPIAPTAEPASPAAAISDPETTGSLGPQSPALSQAEATDTVPALVSPVMADQAAAAAPALAPGPKPKAVRTQAFTAVAAAESPAPAMDATASAPTSPEGPQPMTLATPDPSADGSAETIEPAMYVNMRTAPNSASKVLGVVPKGTRLAVLDRKRGWVQVSYPAVADKGWIYAGNLAGAPRRARRSSRSSDEDSSTFWSRMGNWIGGSASDTQAH